MNRMAWIGVGLLSVVIMSCAPGKGPGASVGCSKTTSIMKAPQIRDENDPLTPPTAEQQRNRVIKLFGSEIPEFYPSETSIRHSTGGLKSAGGYIYVQSRASSEPLGPTQNQYRRCSVLVEFPKNTGDRNPPTTQPDDPQYMHEVESFVDFRLPLSSDAITSATKIRVYTAAHCLDFSLNESVVLSLFKVIDGDLPPPEVAYLDLKVKIPELEAVKVLRKEIKQKIKDESISREEGEKVLNAFRPMARNLEKIFGSGDSSTSRGKCNYKGSQVSSSTEQYSCGTYHDMAVLDVELNESLSVEKRQALKAIRDKWLVDLASEEEKGPWAQYVKHPLADGLNQTRYLVDNFLSPEIDPTLQTDDAKHTHPDQCVGFIDYIKPYCDYFSPAESCPRIVSRLGLFRPSPDNCLEVSLTNQLSLFYWRYIARERLRNFSRYNMVPHVKELTTGVSSDGLNVHLCGSKSEGVCGLKNALETVLLATVPGMQISEISRFQEKYINATNYVDASLSAWNPFFEVAENLSDGLENIESPTEEDFAVDILKSIINPIYFLQLHSNVIVLEDGVNEADYPSSQDAVSHRAFMMMPMANVIGWATETDYPNSYTPIGIENWSAEGAGSGKGKFLRLLVKKISLEKFFDDLVKAFAESEDVTFTEISSAPVGTLFVDASNPALPFQFPSKVFLQKGDSGSIFTLDSIPTFALSTVNGEPTSGGAAVRGVPPDLMDEGVPLRVAVGPGSTTANNSGDGPGAAAGSSGGGPAGGSVAAVATCK